MEPTDEHAELELEDVDVDADTDDGSLLADAYAAAYEAAEATDEGDTDGGTGAGPSSAAGPSRARTPVYYDGKGQHRGVEISIQRAAPESSAAAKKRKPTNLLTPQDRRNRLAAHMLHVLCLIAWARYRNSLLNDDSLQDFLSEMAPEALVTKLRAIHPKKITEQRERVRLFEGFMKELIDWWKSRFRIDPDIAARAAIRQPAAATELLIPANARALPPGKIIDGWVVESAKEREERHRKQKRRKLDTDASSSKASSSVEPATEIAIFPPGQESASSTTLPTYLRLLPAPETIGSAADLQRAASSRVGSRETSAQLFCALCRALGIPARLVVSLQVPPYSVGASKLASIATEADKTIRRNPNGPLSNARRPKAAKVAAATSTVEALNLASPPTVWVEVFSKPFQRWLTVDPVRGELQATGHRYMEPTPHDKDNKLVYVIAVEEDNYCRDVTARYTRSLRSRVARLRPPAAMTGGTDWWDRVVAAIHRPQHLDRDAVEDAEMDQSLQREPMPKSMANFKNHPVYALESQLKRNEAIFPRNRVGTFEGQDVFLRQDVVEVHSLRQWYVNYGRVLRKAEGETESTEEPLKWAKTRGYTIANKRAQEQARAEGRDVPQEGLYAEFQTEVFRAPPVGEDGIIPTNEFGNVDMYVPSMLPPGGAYIPFNGAAKVAKQLHIPYADAVTGFEFRKGRSNPKIEGIVIAQFNAQTVLDAFWESERVNAEKERRKVQERAIRNWRRAFKAVMISLRIKRQYGPGSSAAADAAFRKAMGRDEPKSAAADRKGKKKEVRQLRKLQDEDDLEDEASMDDESGAESEGSEVGPGGFFAGDDFDGADEEAPAPGGFFAGDDFSMDDHEPPDRSTSAAGNHSSPAQGSASTGKKRKIISLYDMDDDEEDEEEDADALVEPKAVPTKRTRTARKQQLEDDEPVASTSTHSKRTKTTRRPPATKKTPTRSASSSRAAATTATTTTPLRRSTRASARTSMARQRELERSQLDALRDVLDDEDLAREEREIAAAAADLSDGSDDSSGG
ncbi:hypothetical protein OC842_002342 [Tilletia horrida]|uniref:Rad4-domain-containing protein n=1 Tax=Tilletia horrida TaxID=155126 RepID=A0AAN6GDV2_9BASI|nr:hypothetical protein OC842_002342 [Tilletia horrida]